MMSLFVLKLFSTLQTGHLIQTRGLFALLPSASVNWKFFKHPTQTEWEHSLDHIGNFDLSTDDFSAASGSVQKGCWQTGQRQAAAVALSILEGQFIILWSFGAVNKDLLVDYISAASGSMKKNKFDDRTVASIFSSNSRTFLSLKHLL